uniref:Uncharacterized protein n=1 Tax=Craspedostauros australis TaxID=1486917 RepID=A0A7S0F4L3_9STRA|mmetsp:Transcript_5680/g.15409  ORF Transcript_5680/g.15409 Transcript_5680/m.15409 type:complete len:192 (+) Transcript_5680:128-703(+)|eukprot:CAMPEP_0198119976 /NCGR_PEP_ID=MMETSP1442-20131203/27597_1 /TAXON_ID= /ORGANISM="Craspedostauros australis, Strain CCMP3328" /LENGTH=191 /DNA_ID=CAMNT_0043778539 /DNA_START=110 /DNA_END=685 /DNA_ORIENTATION=-
MPSKSNSQGGSSSSTEPTLLSKFLSINSKPTAETFPELPDMIIWFRCFLAIFYGAYLGLMRTSTSHASGIIFGLNVITFVPYVYCQTFLGVADESYGNKILFGGVFNALALMLLVWTYFYTTEHATEEAAFAQALLAAKAIVDGEGQQQQAEVGGAMNDASPLEAAIDAMGGADSAAAEAAAAAITEEAEF